MRYGLTLWLMIAGSASAQDFVITERWQPPAVVVQPKRVERVQQATRVTMRWNISGDWSPTEAQTRSHLQREHGVSTIGMTHQQMLRLHDSLHDGGQVPTRRVYVNSGTQWHNPSDCPGGVCPPRRRAVGVR